MTAPFAIARTTRPVVVMFSIAALMVIIAWRNAPAPDMNGGTHPQDMPRYALPGDAQEGLIIFVEKGCMQCHALRGQGGRLGPDLGTPSSRPLNGAQLAGALWNHSPQMWLMMRGQNIESPTLDEKEVADLFALFYAVGYLDRAGNPSRGQDVLNAYGCLQCHDLRTATSTGVPPLIHLEVYNSSIQLAQAMWNHAPRMARFMEQLEVPWPHIDPQALVDLASYLQLLSGNLGMSQLPRAADPEMGSQLFVSKGCSGCHAIRGQHPGESIPARATMSGPDLAGTSTIAHTLTDLAALMWNHAPHMQEHMEELGLRLPTFTGTEMASLIAYLFSIRYFDAFGDTDRGRTVYSTKGCASCHGPTRMGGPDGPSLGALSGRASPISIATGLWNHGPAMLQRLRESGRVWPTFSGTEMSDLIAYLDTPPGTRR